MNLMARKTSSDSGRRVSGIIFRAIQDSFTTQWVAANRRSAKLDPVSALHLRVNRPPRLKPYRIGRVGVV